MDNYGFKNMPCANKKPVGMQGAGGPVKGQTVAGVSSPRAIEPQKIGQGMGPMVQMPVQPKVGK